MRREWESGYVDLAPMVVPSSSTLITEDKENILYTVTVFAKFMDEFTRNCTAKKYVVRQIPSLEDGEKRDAAGMSEEEREVALRAQWSNLCRLVRSNLGEAYVAQLHLKSLRLFVESVLRYGLPAHYLALHASSPDPKSTKSFCKRLLHALEQLRLPGISGVEVAAALHGEEAAVVGAGEAELWAALNMSAKDFEPYVSLPFKIKQ